MKKLALLFSVVFLFGCVKKGEDAIFILPENFTGSVIILYSQKKGADKKYRGDKRVYEIPSSGILKTKFDVEYGVRKTSVFYYSTIEDSRRIPLMVEWEHYSKDKANASLLTTGKSYMNDNNSNYVNFSTFFVGTKSQIEEFSKQLKKVHIADLVEE